MLPRFATDVSDVRTATLPPWRVIYGSKRLFDIQTEVLPRQDFGLGGSGRAGVAIAAHILKSSS
jgi:hypothetical protein